MLVAHLGLVAQRRRQQSLAARAQQQQVLAPVDHHAGKPSEILLAHRLSDNGEGFLGNVVLRHDVIRLVEIDAVDFRHRHEFLDVDAVGALQCHVVELVFLDQYVLALVDLVALDPILGLDRLAGLGIDDVVADAVAGFAVDDVEEDALAGAGGGIKRHGAGDQR